MAAAADPAGAVVELAWIGLRVRHEVSHRLHGQVLPDDDRLRDRAYDADRREVLNRVVSDLLGERRDGNSADAADAEDITVRRRIRDGLRAHDATRSGTIVDNDWLAESPLDVTRRKPAQQVGGPAIRVRHDERNAPA